MEERDIMDQIFAKFDPSIKNYSLFRKEKYRFGVGLANMHLQWRVRDGGLSLKKLAIFKGTHGAERIALIG